MEHLRMHGRIESEIPDRIEYDPSAGSHIAKVAQETVILSRSRRLPVAFQFNGVSVVVTPGDTADGVVERWTAERERQNEEYRKTPEYAKAQADDAARRAANQKRLDEILLDRAMPTSAWPLGGVVAWCVELAKCSQRIDVRWEKEWVRVKLIAAGYKENSHVGRPTEDFEADKTMMGEYIVGQVINNLSHGMPPHPMVIHFAEQAGFVAKEASEN